MATHLNADERLFAEIGPSQKQKALTPAEEFIMCAITIGALELVPGGRKLKSGRISPYFFNSGLFNTGAAISEIASSYGNVILNHFRHADGSHKSDVLYGPPYKGTILVPSIAFAFDAFYGGHSIRFCTSRKEAKDHGEGGSLIGSPIQRGDHVLIIDDVITDGGTKKEAVELIEHHGGIPIGLVIALDRQERGTGELSAVQEFERDYGIPVHAVATLADLISVLQENPTEMLEEVLAYQKQYGVS